MSPHPSPWRDTEPAPLLHLVAVRTPYTSADDDGISGCQILVGVGVRPRGATQGSTANLDPRWPVSRSNQAKRVQHRHNSSGGASRIKALLWGIRTYTE